MASVAGQPRFGIFEISPVGLWVGLAGGLYLLFFSGRLLRSVGVRKEVPSAEATHAAEDFREPGLAGGLIGHAEPFANHVELRPWHAIVSSGIFVIVIATAALDIAPIAAFVITADEACGGLRPEVLMLIAGMIVLGIALDETGLAGAATETLIGTMDDMKDRRMMNGL